MSLTVRTVMVMVTLTARQKTLQDGRTGTWVRKPLQSASGQFICYIDTEGSIDGRPITDDRLHRLVGVSVAS